MEAYQPVGRGCQEAAAGPRPAGQGPPIGPRLGAPGDIIEGIVAPSEATFQRVFETARALGEETRFRIYRQLSLSPDPSSVSQLAEVFSLHPNAILHHLPRLEQAGIVERTRDAFFFHYTEVAPARSR